MDKQHPINEIQDWTVNLPKSVSRIAIQIFEHLPSVLGVIVLLLVG